MIIRYYVKRVALGLAALGLTLIGSTAIAAMTQHWRTDAGSVTWLTTAGNGARGLCYNEVTDHVLVSGTDGGANIQVLNASTGAVIGSMNVTGVSGGSGASLTKVRVINLGSGNYSVFAWNLVLNNKISSLTIYRWNGSASEQTLAAPTVIYRNRASDGTPELSPVGPTMPVAGTATLRIGDGGDVKSFETGVEFYVGRSDGLTQNSVYKFTYTDGDAAVSAAVSAITLTGATGTAYRGTALDAFKGNIYQFSNGTMAGYDNTGGNQVIFPTCVSLGCSHPRYGTVGSRNYVGYVDAISVGNPSGTFRRIAVADVTNGVTNAAEIEVSPMLATTNANTNGTGDFDIDRSRDRFLGLVTNNFVGSFSVPAGVTKTWDGGASTSKWYDVANWNPNGVPTGNDDVVLDNSSVSGGYSVIIDDANTYSCRTIMVGDAISGSTIIFRIDSNAASIAQQALLVAGSQDATNDIVVRNGGRIENLSVATGGNVITNLSGGATARVLSGGYWLHNTGRSFSTPYPPSGNGAITFDSGSTLEFAQATGVSATFSGRTYGNLILSATAAKIYTASGSSGTTIQNTLTLGPNVTFNPSMTTLPTIFNGDIVNNGSGGAISNTATNGVQFNGTSTISGSGTALTFTNGFTVNSGKTLTLGNALTIPATMTGMVNGTLTVNNTLTVNGTLTMGVNNIGGTGIVAVASGATLKTANITGVNGITATGPNTFNSGAKYEFNGTSAQVTGSNLPATVNTLTLNNAAGLTLSGGLYPQTALTLTTGTLDTNGNNLALGVSATSVGTLTYGSTGRIIGAFKRWISTAATFYDFPLKNGSGDLIATVSFSAAPSSGGTLTTEFTATDPGENGLPITTGPLTLANVAQEGYYTIGAGDGLLGGLYATRLGCSWFANRGTADNLRIVKRATGSDPWTLGDQAAYVTGDNTVTDVLARDLSGFSEFAIAGPAGQVPVTMSEFIIE